MGERTTEERLVRLEEENAFLAGNIEKLDQALVFQQEQINALERQLKSLLDDVDKLKDMDGADGIVNAPPPHHNTW